MHLTNVSYIKYKDEFILCWTIPPKTNANYQRNTQYIKYVSSNEDLRLYFRLQVQWNDHTTQQLLNFFHYT